MNRNMVRGAERQTSQNKKKKVGEEEKNKLKSAEANDGRDEIRTWKIKNAIIVGGLAATLAGKSKERRTGGACKKAGNSARIVNIWSCEMQSNLVGCK